MNDTVTLQIELLGSLKKYSDIHTINVVVSKGSKTDEVKKKIIHFLTTHDSNFSDSELIEKSVLANERRILNADELLEADMQLVMLPPVCGG